MKLSVGRASLLLSSLAAVNGVFLDLSSLGTGGQKALAGGEMVPGDNPLMFCQSDHSSDILTLEEVNLSPNPPEAGKTLSIEAKGTLLEDVEDGAKVILQVKYGIIGLVKTEADLCEQVENVDMECPIKKGPITLTKDVELPSQIPDGRYTVFADAYTKDGEHITCLKAAVQFSRK
ncbi:putative Phosphatidylglycerol/phosphatidylinositol transfer protein [Diplocarpon rosae]|nr:putative Phosphatidylglycerol/phosphatidylinositol transfer protein [Diplocarpon rosae]